MQVSENRERPFDAKEVMIQCTGCLKYAIVVFPYMPTAQQRIQAIRDAAEEHRKWCSATAPEEQKEYEIWYPRK